jgi:aspartyl protease family protein
MVDNQQRLVGFLAITLMSASVLAQDIAVLGLLADRAIVKVDGDTHILKLGENYEDIRLVAVNSQEARLSIGGKERVFGLGQDYSAIKKSTTSQGAVEISANANDQFITNGMINGNVVEFLVDTGANMVSMNRKDAKRLGIDYRRLGKEGLSGTANGTVKNWQILLNKVKVGAITVTSVQASVRDTEDNMPVLLGMSFLGRVNMTHEGSRLKLTGK